MDAIINDPTNPQDGKVECSIRIPRYGNSAMKKSAATMRQSAVPEIHNNGPCRRPKNYKPKTNRGQLKHVAQQQQRDQEQDHNIKERRDDDRVAEHPNSGGSAAAVDGDRVSAIGYELVRQYYTVLYNAPEHAWRFYAEHAQYCHVYADGTTTVAVGRPQVRDLFGTTAAAEKCDGGSGYYRQPVVVESVNAVRCAPDQLLVMATSERFAQSFVVAFRPPRSFAVVASIVQHAFVALVAGPPPVVNHRDTRAGRTVAGRSPPNDCQLFIGHLSDSTTSEQLYKTFAAYGEVVQVRLMGGYSRNGGPAKYNYAFVKFSVPGSVAAVLASRPITLCDGSPVNVYRSKPCPRVRRS